MKGAEKWTGAGMKRDEKAAIAATAHTRIAGLILENWKHVGSHPTSSNVNSGEGEDLTGTTTGPDKLAEEIDLPEGILVDLDELAPGALAPLRSRLKTVFDQNILNRLAADRTDFKLSEFDENSGVAPARFLGQLDDQFMIHCSQSGPAFPFRLNLALFLPDPTLLAPTGRSAAERFTDQYARSRLRRGITHSRRHDVVNIATSLICAQIHNR